MTDNSYSITSDFGFLKRFDAYIVQLLRRQAAGLIQAQVFLRHVGIKDQHVIGIHGDVDAVAVQPGDGVACHIRYSAQQGNAVLHLVQMKEFHRADHILRGSPFADMGFEHQPFLGSPAVNRDEMLNRLRQLVAVQVDGIKLPMSPKMPQAVFEIVDGTVPRQPDLQTQFDLRRDTHVDSLMERMREPRVKRIVEPLILGNDTELTANDDDWRFITDLGLLRVERGTLVPANPMYAEIIGRYLSRGEQDRMIRSVPDTPWVKDDGLDMAGLMAAFQQFWRENSGADRDIMGYREAVPHLVLMAFLQRVTNGGGHINREMAVGTGRLDLCVEFRGARYAIEVKTSDNFKGEKSYEQCAQYLDTLKLTEGWMPIFDKSKTKTWDEKIYTRDESFNGKTIHVLGL